MRITVLFNGVLQQLAGQQCVLEMETPGTVETALATLSRVMPALSPHISRTACAIGADIVNREHLLADGDKLVLIPPVSGG